MRGRIIDFEFLNMKKVFLLLAATALLSGACKKEEEYIVSFSYFQILISTEKCMTTTPAPFDEAEGRMIKRIGDNNGWHCSFLPFMIRGFEYKEGYEYELLVRETILKPRPDLMDYNTHVYTLSEVILMTPVD